MSEEKINYTVEDIHLYFSGKMTTSQMHAMEKAALNDPLLAEAMEGFSSLPSFTDEKKLSKLQKELNDLKSRLTAKNTETRRYNDLKWKAAAAVLLLFGSVLALYIIKRNNNKQETIIASTPAKPVLDSVNSAGKDSAVIAKNIIQQADSSKDIASNNTTSVTDIKEENKMIAATKLESPVVIQMNKELNNARVSELSKSVKISGNIFSGKVTDADNNAIAYANLIINNNQQSKTDANGMFNLAMTDSIIRLDVTAANYYPKTTKVTANNFTTITLDTKKRTIRKNNNLTDTFTRSFVQVLYKRGVEPKRGWEEYRLFLVDQLSNSQYDDGRRVTGETIFSFEINRLGQPDNFYFEKSIDQDVNDALENFIITGPEWKFLSNAGTPGIVKLRIIF